MFPHIFSMLLAILFLSFPAFSTDAGTSIVVYMNYQGIYYDNPVEPYRKNLITSSVSSRLRVDEDKYDYFVTPVEIAGYVKGKSDAALFHTDDSKPVYLYSRTISTDTLFSNDGTVPILGYMTDVSAESRKRIRQPAWTDVLPIPANRQLARLFSSPLAFDFTSAIDEVEGVEVMRFGYSSRTFTQRLADGVELTATLSGKALSTPDMELTYCHAYLYNCMVTTADGKSFPFIIVGNSIALENESGREELHRVSRDTQFSEFIQGLENLEDTHSSELSTVNGAPAWFGSALSSLELRRIGACVAMEKRTNSLATDALKMAYEVSLDVAPALNDFAMSGQQLALSTAKANADPKTREVLEITDAIIDSVDAAAHAAAGKVSGGAISLGGKIGRQALEPLVGPEFAATLYLSAVVVGNTAIGNLGGAATALIQFKIEEPELAGKIEKRLAVVGTYIYDSVASTVSKTIDKIDGSYSMSNIISREKFAKGLLLSEGLNSSDAAQSSYMAAIQQEAKRIWEKGFETVSITSPESLAARRGIIEKALKESMSGYGSWYALALKETWHNSGVKPGRMPSGLSTTPDVLGRIMRDSPRDVAYTYRGSSISVDREDGRHYTSQGNPMTMSVVFNDSNLTTQNAPLGSFRAVTSRSGKIESDYTWYYLGINMAGTISRTGLQGTVTKVDNRTTGGGWEPTVSNVEGQFYGSTAQGVGGTFKLNMPDKPNGSIEGSFGLIR